MTQWPMADKMVQLLERQIEDMRQERDAWREAFGRADYLSFNAVEEP
jgi:hypothetical protein